LTQQELSVLDLTDSKYHWLARDKDDTLFFFEHKPHKSEKDGMWYPPLDAEKPRIFDYDNECLFNAYFEEIKWTDEEPYQVRL
jgi:hypothetical protein